MSQFWPTGINLKARSPLQIMQQAASDWTTGSKGKLSLKFEYLEGKTIVLASSNQDIQKLFTIHRDCNQYPVAIVPSHPLSSPLEFSEAFLQRLNEADVKSTIYNMLIDLEDDEDEDECKAPDSDDWLNIDGLSCATDNRIIIFRHSRVFKSNREWKSPHSLSPEDILTLKEILNSVDSSKPGALDASAFHPDFKQYSSSDYIVKPSDHKWGLFRLANVYDAKTGRIEAIIAPSIVRPGANESAYFNFDGVNSLKSENRYWASWLTNQDQPFKLTANIKGLWDSGRHHDGRTIVHAVVDAATWEEAFDFIREYWTDAEKRFFCPKAKDFMPKIDRHPWF